MSLAGRLNDLEDLSNVSETDALRLTRQRRLDLRLISESFVKESSLTLPDTAVPRAMWARIAPIQ